VRLFRLRTHRAVPAQPHTQGEGEQNEPAAASSRAPAHHRSVPGFLVRGWTGAALRGAFSPVAKAFSFREYRWKQMLPKQAVMSTPGSTGPI